MLTRLYVSNVVLIDRLELDFPAGLSVLTGETGAGKSILLDALGLALGAKADADLIRAGADEAIVVADFDGTILKRSITPDGKSKCWINNEPATIKALKETGEQLAEVHGQFANHGLLDEKTHIASLDDFGAYPELTDIVASHYEKLHAAERRLKDLRELLDKSAAEREWVEHSARELAALGPRAGEEAELAARRQLMMDAEKNAGTLKDALSAIEGGDLAERIFSAAHILERTKSYQPQIDKLYEAGSALQDVAEQLSPKDGFDAAELESAEERLFALRAAARKHRVAVDELPATLEKLQNQLGAIDNSDAAVKDAEKEIKTLRAEYDRYAGELTRERIAAAGDLAIEIKNQLPDLKLGGADFKAEVSPAAPGPRGSDAVRFMIKTNPGQPFAPLDKIASGGELARFMLALRVALAGGDNRTLIFDEIDTGISGATAAAVGARLAALSAAQQIIVITHSAQVAGYGAAHFLISKATDGKTTATRVEQIAGAERANEIARIISGEKITKDSLAAAKELLKH
ncbi:MAG: DNA repair protein RecN [Rickettsiales bacterium]|nr:DNA repair protein RecN [Rickettsiales bacterium]